MGIYFGCKLISGMEMGNGKYYMEGICVGCKKTFVPNHGTRKYCTKDCWKTFNKSVTQNSPVLDCPECGTSFKRKRVTQKACSAKCNYEHNMRAKRPGGADPKTKGTEDKCLRCNKTYIRRGYVQKYCTRLCLRIVEGRAREVSPDCAYCGVKISPGRSKYCSPDCHHKGNYLTRRDQGKDGRKVRMGVMMDSKKKQGKCAECSETRLELFEFAHYRREDRAIRSVHDAKSRKELEDELPKGRWLCAWCHRLETVRENAALFPIERRLCYSNGRGHITNMKLTIGQCALCERRVEEDTVACFEYDHIDPSKKTYVVSQIANRKTEIIDAEIAKCRLLCCICHRLHSIAQQRERGLRIREENEVKRLAKRAANLAAVSKVDAEFHAPAPSN